jgi:hypothetical protein
VTNPQFVDEEAEGLRVGRIESWCQRQEVMPDGVARIFRRRWNQRLYRIQSRAVSRLGGGGSRASARRRSLLGATKLAQLQSNLKTLLLSEIVTRLERLSRPDIPTPYMFSGGTMQQLQTNGTRVIRLR